MKTKTTKKQVMILLAVVLVVFTAAMAVLHLGSYKAVPEESLLIVNNGKEYTLSASDFVYEQVQGTRVNGKGEEITIDAEGVSLQSVLLQAGIEEYTQADVISEDSYHAVVLAEEAALEGKVYLTRQEEGGLRLTVFGDSNSKRSVSDVVQIVVE